MARSQPELDITLSVLDRLIDHDPRTSTEAPSQRAESVRKLKNSLRRDLAASSDSFIVPHLLDVEVVSALRRLVAGVNFASSHKYF